MSTLTNRTNRDRNRALLAWWLAFACAVTKALADEPSAPVGWAAEGAGTSGGGGGPVHTISTVDELVAALKLAGPVVIQIRGGIQASEPIRLSSNISLIGLGKEAAIRGGGLKLRKTHNVIVRNLAISEAGDAIEIDESHHVWIDHCDLSRCRDGLLDIKHGSDLITVSWNHFHDHGKTCLLGHSDKDSIRDLDRGHLRVTYHHNYFDGTRTRHPRVRFAEGVHVFNNYFRGNEYGVASVMDAGVIVEGNVFEDVERPTLTAYGDSPDPGRLMERHNLFLRSGLPETRGTVDASVLGYRYTLDPADSIATRVRALWSTGGGNTE